MNSYEIILLTLLILTIIICMKLIMDDEWYLVATLLTGLFLTKEELRELLENED